MRHVLLLPMFLVFIVACTNFGNRGDQGTNVGGVDMRFLSGYSPDVFRNVPANTPIFRVGLELMNKMDYTVDGKVCVYDLLADDYGGIQGRDCKDFSIRGREEGLLAEKQNIIFPSIEDSYQYDNLPPLIEDTEIFAEVSYKVDTEVRATICLNKDPLIPIDELPCNPNIVNIISKEVVPVTVTSIEPNIYSVGDANSVNLRIKLKKAAKGEVVHFEDLGKIGVKRGLLWMDVKIEGTSEEFTCTPSEEDKFIRMDKAVIKGDTREIDCSSQVTIPSDNPTYEAVLTIRLMYGYEIESDPKTILFEWREDRR